MTIGKRVELLIASVCSPFMLGSQYDFVRTTFVNQTILQDVCMACKHQMGLL